jgi:hypothetical protein
MSVDEFIETIVRPEVERDIDAQIEAEPDAAVRALLRRHRGMLVSRTLDVNRIANLKHQLDAAEERLARLEPQLVEEDQ